VAAFAEGVRYASAHVPGAWNPPCDGARNTHGFQSAAALVQ
jgi:hypothetical protein